ncbi:SRPBCC domain-containing protein [Streptomyces fulvoviolaceus]|uniref:SRPBCC domain-containing protein n=1 Tax=Streptomyces fulvoviolaceus TaxID=285535 RepID=UPI000D12A384|nr:SRPBCC domain-containing protein [Streptomyces fulvoviolaceus]MCT9078962.1 SRPBCC domain-containing protein [Streptomyces fulvoviolaceus]
MEHEVFVPVPVELLREALADPARVARAVPGFQQDAGAEPVAGRLKVRVGSTSITYRGSVRVSGQDDGSYAVEGDATEARGTGSVKLALTLRLRDTDGGTTLTFDGTASADGRVTELSPDTVTSAVTRLLNRFAENLGAEEPEEAEIPEEPEAPEPVAPPPVLDTEVPPPALVEDLTEPTEPPAEAAHARRTMIGRSAEEVDHAPPRGRYAPVPAPQTVAPNAALRWAAPAAAVVLASAIVVGRALRKRH